MNHGARLRRQLLQRRDDGTSGRVELVDHEVDDDAGDGDVEPQWKGPAGDEAMLIETLEKRAAQCDQYEGNDHDGEYCVRGEEGEVDRTNPALALKVDYLANTNVIDDVGDQKRAGDYKGGNHQALVDLDFMEVNREVTTGEEDGADAVECGVEGGLGHGVGGLLAVLVGQDTRYRNERSASKKHIQTRRIDRREVLRFAQDDKLISG